MSSSLRNLCRVPALVEILNHPHLKKEVFSLPINSNNYKERDVALRRAVSEFLKDYNHVLKWFTPKHFILLIGFEMWKWAEYQKRHFGLSFEFSQNFIRSSLFTSKGLIDEEKAARKLLMEKSLSNFLRYSIACQYFLEDIIPCLWQELNKNDSNFGKKIKEHKPRLPMALWYNYLKKKNSASTLQKKVITRRFKVRVFSYGLEHKNVAAVKFSLGSKEGSRKNKTEAKIVRKLVYKSFCDYVNPLLENEMDFSVSIDSLFKTKFLADRSIILYFISLMNKRELKEFFKKFYYSFTIFRLFLLWPYQNQFMDFAYFIFENSDLWEHNMVMTEIIEIISNQHMCEFYNYRFIFRDFWIKCPPHMKKEIIKSESDSEGNVEKVIVMLFKLRKFTSEDLVNINLILEYANSAERKDIFMKQGICIIQCILFLHKNFELADSFLKNQDLNQGMIQWFKEDVVLYSTLDIMVTQDLNFVDKIFKWVVGSDDIDDFQEKILQRWTQFNKIEFLFWDLEEETPFSFLNKILKWFLKTDEKIEEFKRNIVYSPLVQYFNSKWFDKFLKYQGHSQEEASVIKSKLLFRNLPNIARSFLNNTNAEVKVDCNVFYLCSYKKKKLREFTDQLRSFYEHSIKQKLCLLCLNNNHVLGNGEEAQINCQIHERNGFISLDEIEKICSSILKQLRS